MTWTCGPKCPLYRVACGSWAAAATGECNVSVESLEAKLAEVERYKLSKTLADTYRAAIAARRAAEAEEGKA